MLKLKNNKDLYFKSILTYVFCTNIKLLIVKLNLIHFCLASLQDEETVPRCFIFDICWHWEKERYKERWSSKVLFIVSTSKGKKSLGYIGFIKKNYLDSVYKYFHPTIFCCFFLSQSESETSLIEQKRQGLLELKYTIRD